VPAPAYIPTARVLTVPPPASPAPSPAPGRVDRPAADSANHTVASLVRALARDEPSTRHVLFTSVEDSPGAADVVIQVAAALAGQSSGPVYLVDMDLNYPSLHLRFDLTGKNGFSDALKTGGGLRDYSCKVESTGDLWVMPAGLPMGALAPARGLLAARPAVGDDSTQRRIATLIDTHDYVIVYTAAIGSYPDAELIGRLFDGVVLVVQEGTPAEATRRAANAVKASKSRLLGTVLDNGVTFI
jgi:Mrp family chromosome partitioning ATPase